MPIHRNYFAWLAIILCGAFLNALIHGGIFCRARLSTGHENNCFYNLMVISGAKQTWAMETRANSNTIPAWENLQPYIGRGPAGTRPICPQGGIYTIGKIKDPPTCSIKGHTLD
jgi:hypothetical protein